MTDALTRRGFLRLALAASATLPLGTGESGADSPQSAEPPTPSWLDAALQAARWLQTTQVGTPQGLLWLNGPERPEGMISTPDLYSGTSGVVLFLLELARATGDKAWREEATAGADYLIATLPERIDPARAETGLYTGAAGIGFTLHRVYKETGDEKYRKAALRCRDLIHAAAQPAGVGVQWGDVTDIIAGASGTGLYLLNVAREMDDSASRDLAVRAGLRLAELGIPEAGGLKWRMDPEFKRLMPNFSHGTAGIAYFLATLHRETGRQEFRDAALAGARYLQAIANTQGDGCVIFHNEPEGKDLYYLSWCHGPVGTARLWVRLHQIDSKAGWLDWAKKGAKSILASGVPEEKTPGFWNNDGQCCGSAGLAAFFLDLAKLTGDDSYRAHARRAARHLVAHGTATPGGGLKWIHAEHRVRPDYTYAQTGYMQGAAGIGMLLLQMDVAEKNREWTFRLPDSPF